MNDLERAKRLISEFWDHTGEMEYIVDEYGENHDPLYLLEAIHLAHADYSNNRSVVVQVDLTKYCIMTMVDEMYWLRSDQYESLQHLVDEGLSNLDYDRLVHVSDEEWRLIEETSKKLNHLAYEKNDLAAWKDLILSIFPIVHEHKPKHEIVLHFKSTDNITPELVEELRQNFMKTFPEHKAVAVLHELD